MSKYVEPHYFLKAVEKWSNKGLSDMTLIPDSSLSTWKVKGAVPQYVEMLCEYMVEDQEDTRPSVCVGVVSAPREKLEALKELTGLDIMIVETTATKGSKT